MAKVTLRTAEMSFYKSLNQFPCLGIVNYKVAKADNVHIVVFNSLTGGKMIMNQSGMRSVNLVGDNAYLFNVTPLELDCTAFCPASLYTAFP